MNVSNCDCDCDYVCVVCSSVWPDAETYCGAMSACGQAGEWQRALILLEDMVKKVGITPHLYLA
jgi:pentatricopeptide repeat protein